MLALYQRYKEGKDNYVDPLNLCEEEQIGYDSAEALGYAMDALQEDGFVKLAKFSGGSSAITQYKPKAIDYVEQHLLPHVEGAMGSAERQASQGASSADGHGAGDPQRDASPAPTSTSVYTAKQIDKDLIDANMPPCFGVDRLARCFADQLRRAAVTDQDNISMVGILGPWGRGKTYFFAQVEKQLEREQYKVVKFSAWKYQRTPAIWAYLYETIYNSCNGWQKIKFWLKDTPSAVWKPLLIACVLIGVLCGIGALLGSCDVLQKAATYLRNLGIPATVLGFTVYMCDKVKKIQPTAFKLIERYTHRKSYESYLGIQNEIERDLARLLNVCVNERKNERLLLYIDDVDRCTPAMMIEVVESLRTVLESEEIRRKLIVVCSVDAEKLKMGYKNAYKDVCPEEKSDELAREQLDKLFIFSMALPPLDHDQQSEFINALVKQGTQEGGAERNDTPFSTARISGSMVVTTSGEQITSVNEDVLADLLKTNIEGKKALTPRKLRIIFYQLLLANNILAQSGADAKMLENTAIAIINKSLGEKVEINNSVAQSDVVDMVVGY